MKKFLFAFLALASVSAMAENHVYTKVGADLFTRYSKVADEEGAIFKSEKGNGYGFFLEATRDFTPNLELGAGVAYIRRANGKNMSENENIDGEITAYSWDTPRYSSIPLYLTAKYNFDTNSTIKPYVKFDLGYSFNKINKNTKFAFKDSEESIQDSIPTKVKNGLYTGFGIGAEYNNFLAELSYNFTSSKVSAKNTDYDYDVDKKYNNKALRLSVGYKFNF